MYFKNVQLLSLNNVKISNYGTNDNVNYQQLSSPVSNRTEITTMNRKCYHVFVVYAAKVVFIV